MESRGRRARSVGAVPREIQWQDRCGRNPHTHEPYPHYYADRDAGFCTWAARAAMSSPCFLPTAGSEVIVVLKGLVVRDGPGTQDVDVGHFGSPLLRGQGLLLARLWARDFTICLYALGLPCIGLGLLRRDTIDCIRVEV